MAISNNSTGLRPGVCTSSTRPTAPYEGQMIYETDTDLTYIWGGSAWQQVSGGTAVGNSGLVYLTSTAIGSGVSSFIAPAFNSTYDNYLIRMDNVTYSAANDNISMQLRIGTSTATANNYYYGLPYLAYGNTTGSAAGNGVSSFAIIGRSLGAGDKASIFFNVNQPFLAVKTSVSSVVMGSDLIGPFAGYHNVNTAYDQIVMSTSGTMTGGTFTVFGYRK